MSHEESESKAQKPTFTCLTRNLISKNNQSFNQMDLEVSNLLARRTHKQQNKDFNNFQVRRSCFWNFSKYYKKRFQPLNKLWQRQRVNKKKKSSVPELIRDFCNKEFGQITQNMTDSEF